MPRLTARLLVILYVGVQCGRVARKDTRTTAHHLDVVAIDRVAPAGAGTASGSHGAEPADVLRPKSMRAEKACPGEVYDKFNKMMRAGAVVS